MAIIFGSTSNTPQPVNPKFKNYQTFAKYCYLYDPLVDLERARGFDIAILEYQGKWYRKGFSYLGKYCDLSKLQYYYTCHSLCREKVISHKAIQLVEHFQKQSFSFKPSSHAHRRLLKELDEKLDRYELVKQYIYYSCDQQDGWMIIWRNKNIINEAEDPCIGIGKTLQEADINFKQNQADRFTANFNYINFLLDNEIPITPKEMFNVCYKFDQSIDELSIKRTNIDQNIISNLSSRYRLQCRSKETRFILEVYLQSQQVNWRVVKFWKVDTHFLEKLSVEGSAKGLQEAFQACQEKFNYLQNNPEALQQAIYEAEQQARGEEMEDLAREGQETLNWLLSEFGEDAICSD